MRVPVRNAFVAIALFVSCLPSARCASLSWLNPVQAFTIESGQKEVVTNYEFKNNADHSIVIKSIETSCGCTVADLDKKTYSSGETGKLKVVFSVGERVGLQEKTILIKTEEATEPPYALQLTVDIKPFFTVQPRLVFWSVGDKLEEMSVGCSAGTDRLLFIKRLVCSDPNFTARFEIVESGKIFKIYVTPKSTAKAMDALVSLKLEIAGVGEKDVSIFAVIK